MDRRTLMIGLSAAATWFSISGYARLVFNGQAPGSGDAATPPMPLSDQLAELADPLFRDYSAGRSVNALLSEMVHKGVISTHAGVNHKKLINLASQDPLIIYKGFYYTHTELELYALAYLHKDQNRDTQLVSRGQ